MIPTDGTYAFAWYLSRVEDIHGNYMEYTYHNVKDDNEFWLEEIKYTGNGTNDPYNSVKFFYELREDIETGYIEGTILSQKGLLYKIKILAEGEQLVREYQFEYATDFNYSHLVKVTEHGSDGSELNSTIFEYEETTNNLTSYDTYESPDFNRFVFGDFNGDGRDDFITYEIKDDYVTNDRYDIYYANEDGKDFTKYSHVYVYTDFDGTIYTGDFNGDGKTDWVERENKGGHSRMYETHTSISSTTSFTINYDHNIFIVDYDGDGRLEFLVKKNESGNYWYIYDEQGTLKKSGTIASWGSAYYIDLGIHNRILDFDGDGKSDIITFNSSGFKVYKFPTTGSAMIEISSGTYPTNSEFELFGDYNGDGKTDMVSCNSSGQWNLHFSKGSNFGTKDIDVFDNFDIDIQNNNRVYAHDMDGDGKTDVVFVGRGQNLTNPQNRINVGYSIGDGFSISEKITGFNFDLFKEYLYKEFYGREVMHFGDFNGDGKINIFYNYYNNGTITYPCGGGTCTITDYNQEIEKIFFLNYGQKEHLLRKALNGFNHKTEIAYQPLSNNSIYSKASTYNRPVIIDYQGPLYVVSQFNVDNGIGGTDTISYAYEGARVHREGKGFLGFEKVTSYGHASGIENITVNNYYYYLYPNTYFYGQNTDKIETKVHGGNTISEVDFAHSVKNFGNKRIFPYILSKTSIDKLKTPNYKTIEAYTYDETNGNLTKHGTEFKEGDNLVSSTVVDYNTYTDAITTDGNTYLNKPGEIVATNTREGETFTRKVNLTYNTNGTVLTKITDQGKAKAVTTTYAYYSSGHKKGMVDRLTLTATGYDSRYTDYEYDSKGRAVTKQTDALGNWAASTFDWRWGSVLTETTSGGTEVTYTYDAFGRLLTSTANTGESASRVYAWEDNSIEKGRYSITTTGNDGSFGKEYFDVLGRGVRKQGKNFNGGTVYSDTRYKADGKLDWASEPYFSGTPNKTVYSYLADGRVGSITQPTATIDYSYTGATVTVKNISAQPNQESSKTFDAPGNLKSASDDGGSISYKYHPSGQVDTIECNGGLIVMKYDEYGMQDTLIDPDAGEIIYDYTPFGELKMQRDARQSAGQEYTMAYDRLGRILTKTGQDGTTTYEYYTTGNGKGQLKKVSKSGTTNSVGYEYDSYGRLDKETHKYDTKTFIYDYGYDNKNRLSKLTYPSGFIVKYVYNSYGYLSRVTDNSGNMIWEGTSTDQYGQWEEFEYGNDLVAKKTYDSYGFPQTIKTGTTGDDDFIQYNGYQFEAATGNLEWRTNHKRSLTENFGYDDLNRLTGITGATTMQIGYKGTIGSSTNGNIGAKTNIGTYEYELPQPHAVSKITGPGTEISGVPQYIHYTPFNKIDTITQGIYELDVVYDPFNGRRKTVLKENSAVKITKYFVGNYEEVTESGTTKQRHFISSPSGLVAVMEKTGTTENMYYIHPDYLGSIQYITNSSGTREEEYSYDAWGRLRDPADWSDKGGITPKFDRGYTTHEHLPEFSLVNMNGRVYDPALGRMLSPDNYVQAAGYTQSFNRYSYCLNNPLIYTDPSGEFITWSIGNGGFSIGFNLTPIGIPLGAGINIGYGDGFAPGVYGEVGYRVGGTGLGAGVAAQQSLDYNFKHNNWSTTTTELAYASFGPATVGGNLSQTYDITNNQWHHSWGVNAGLGIGDEHGGIGFSVGYGSGGWTYGLSGFHTTSYERAYMRAEQRNRNNIDAAFVNYELSTGGDRVYYGLGSQSYSKYHFQYLPVEGVGIGGGLHVRGNANIYYMEGQYYANVSASAYAPASRVGSVNYSGTVDVLSGKRVMGSYTLTPYSGPSFSQTGWTHVGQNAFALPSYSYRNVSLRFNIGYSYSSGAGYVVPIPARGRYIMPIGFTIDAVTY